MTKAIKVDDGERVNVDRFDEPFQRATNGIAVLHALADAQSSNHQNQADDDNDMWWGIRDLTERALADLKQMGHEYTQAANYVYDLEQAAKGKGNKGKGKKGGAR
jgi:hypothetical protein